MSEPFSMTQFLVQQLSGSLDKSLAETLVEQKRHDRQVEKSKHGEWLEDRLAERIAQMREQKATPTEIKAVQDRYQKRIAAFG